jgi:hypothetical protein
MTTRCTQPRRRHPRRQVSVWIARDRAVITSHEDDGHEMVHVLARLPTESEVVFDVRAIDEVVDDERVEVSGPASDRTEFERTYVAVTHRPDRLLDVEPIAPPARTGRWTASGR